MIPAVGWWAQFRGADGKLDSAEEAPLVCWVAGDGGLPVGVIADDAGPVRCDELDNFAGYYRQAPIVAAVPLDGGSSVVLVDADGTVDVRWRAV